MLKPLPTQLSGAKFLAERKTALLADAPRVGKTGAAIMGADYIFARAILVVTTASGRSVWQRAFPQWSTLPRNVQVLMPSGSLRPDADVVIVGWGSISDPAIRSRLLMRKWDLVISDEDHWAKSFDAARTRAFYGDMIEDGGRILISTALAKKAETIWLLTGTPLPNSQLDAYPRLRVLQVEKMLANPAKGWPDVTKFPDFRNRYCVWHPMKVGRGAWAKWVDVVTKGKNEEEFRERFNGWMLLRTQEDVGIRPPVYETFPLIVSEANRKAADAGLKSAAVLAAAENGSTSELDMSLGPKRRLTGEIKARAVVEAVREEFAGGLKKIVLAYWHKDVGDILEDGLSKLGTVRLDGSSSDKQRLHAEVAFRTDPRIGVFLGQIQAAGEAIDLSVADELLCVEVSLIPKDMKQIALRITNNQKAGLTRVRVASLSGSIDEPLQEILLRKWSSIRKVLTQ
jgi:SWI/SNF-related matrix-associated actin-dependent regulator 1 of chromatin subfamily A